MSRKTPSRQRETYTPPNDQTTYRDLLLFEERLKTNAANLKRRKSRYQLFLFQLLAIIFFLMSEVLLQTQFMSIPYKYILRKFLPDIYADDTEVTLHPLFATGLLTVAVTTLLLFFASGLYSEKIGYANRYVPHANKALRSFNIHLNVRHRPLRSRLFFKPLSFLFGRGSVEEGRHQQYPTIPRTPSPDRRPRRGNSVPIAPIPPAKSPRGELIFSSRVERSFIESYERYRAAFERKREEREQAALAQTWYGWRLWPWNWPWLRTSSSSPVQIQHHALSTPTGSSSSGSGVVGGSPGHHHRGHSPSSSITSRGRATDTESAGSTPSSSRRPSPVPGSLGRPKANRSGTPPGAVPLRMMSDRARKESFSYLLSGDQRVG